MSLDNIRQVSIIDIISPIVALKQKGRNHLGLCPFHNEKSPSFTVSEDKGIYKCFGCGKGGDGISFYMEYNKLGFMEACKQIANEKGIEFQPEKISKEEIDISQKRHDIYQFHQTVTDWYREQLPLNKEASAYAKDRFAPDQIDSFQIGYAPAGFNTLFEAMKKRGYLEEFLLTTNMFTQKDNGKVYDFFQNRIMFPIHNHIGNIVGFGARALGESKPKYLNSPESFFYDKSKTLYGLFQARQAIREEDCINLMEGYTDVISAHPAGYADSVATCGTSLTEQQCRLLMRYTTNITLVADADAAGHKSMQRSAEMLIKQGFRVSITHLPKGEDPDSFFRAGNKILDSHNFLMDKARELFHDAEQDPIRRADNMQEMGRWLNMVSSMEQSSLIDYICKTYKAKGVTKAAMKIAVETSRPRELQTNDHPDTEMDESHLPKYVDRDKFRKYGFYVSRGEKGDMYAPNQYIFGEGRISNFIMEPLYHVEGDYETKKLFKITNKYGVTNVIELDMEAMNSVPRFKKTIESVHNYLFEGKDTHLNHLKRLWYDETKYCKKVENLGWQKEGFWAWANGMTTTNNVFIPCDENGIVNYEKKDFFIAPSSIVYKGKENLFESQRKFKYMDTDVSFNEWAKLFLSCYGSQGKISIAFYLTSLFSDFIFAEAKNLPTLNIYGQPGTGKNQQAMSLLALFGYVQKELQLSNATKAGLAAHLEEFVNAIWWVDEYKNSLPIETIEILKAVYNRNGRTRQSMKENGGSKKESTPVNSMGIITGQEMLTFDQALFQRNICLTYYKTDFTPEEEKRLKDLQKMQNKGLSHFTSMLIRERKTVEDNYRYKYNEASKEIRSRINIDEKSPSSRLLENFTTILASFKCLEDTLQKMQLPFTYDSLLDECVSSLMQQSQLLRNSNELASFWGIIESGVENSLIIDHKQYKIKECTHLRILVKGQKEPQQLTFENTESQSKTVLLLKWAGIYQYYAETARRTSQHALPESTLLHYLQTSSYYIGKVKAVKFDQGTFQAMAFDYNAIEVNLQRTISKETGIADTDDTQPPPTPEQAQEIAISKEIQQRMSEDKDKEDLPF